MTTFDSIAYTALLISFSGFFAHGVYAQIKMERDARDSLFNGFDALVRDWNRIDTVSSWEAKLSADEPAIIVKSYAISAAIQDRATRKARARTKSLRRNGMLHSAKPYRFKRKS